MMATYLEYIVPLHPDPQSSDHDDDRRQRIVGRATLVEKIAAQVFLFFVVSLSFCFLFVILNSQVFTEQDKVRGSGGSGGEYTTQPETSPDTSPVSSPGIFSLYSPIPNSNLSVAQFYRILFRAKFQTTPANLFPQLAARNSDR